MATIQSRSIQNRSTQGRSTQNRSTQRQATTSPAERRRAREERQAEQLADDPEGVARELCLRLLTARPRSAGELAEALAGRGVEDDVAVRVLDRLTEVGLVDDQSYAEVYVRSRHAERGLARRALRGELRRRGVDDAIAEGALEQVDDDAEEDAARVLARKRLAVSRRLPYEVRLRRASGALARRGHSPATAYRVVREELAAEGSATVSGTTERLGEGMAGS